MSLTKKESDLYRLISAYLGSERIDHMVAQVRKDAPVPPRDANELDKSILWKYQENRASLAHAFGIAAKELKHDYLDGCYMGYAYIDGRVLCR